MTVYAVVTKVPDTSKGEEGNLATALASVWVCSGEGGISSAGPRSAVEVLGAGALALHMEVFALGEVLILDSEYGRERHGHGRKPSKWSVGIEHFGTVEEALERAQKVEDDDLAARATARAAEEAAG